MKLLTRSVGAWVGFFDVLGLLVVLLPDDFHPVSIGVQGELQESTCTQLRGAEWLFEMASNLIGNLSDKGRPSNEPGCSRRLIHTAFRQHISMEVAAPGARAEPIA